MTKIELKHKPVMLKEVIKFLKPYKQGIYVDATFGMGGYTKAILTSNKQNKVISIDKDPKIKCHSYELQQIYKNRFIFLSGCFSNIKNIIQPIIGINNKVDGICLDLGIASNQLNKSERGFSFNLDGPLDMRINQENQIKSAYKILSEKNEKELSNIFWKYGEDPYSQQIAKKIINYRLKKKINSTKQLYNIINYTSKNNGNKKYSINAATRIFQALRIYINNELKELNLVLEGANNLLNPGGRLIITTFHSLEDKIIKNFFKKKFYNYKKIEIKNDFDQYYLKSFYLPIKQPLKANNFEIRNNPKSRSSKLWIAFKITSNIFH